MSAAKMPPSDPQTIPESELNRLFETYLPKLVKLADSRIAEWLQKNFGPDDIAATVCKSVFRRFKEGKFRFDDDAEFWRLLVIITKRKISNKVRHYSTKSRSSELEVSLVANEILSLPEPGPDDAAAFRESMKLLTQQLDSQENEVLLLRMDGHEYHEIADRLGVSERTVRRKMDVIRERMNRLFPLEPS